MMKRRLAAGLLAAMLLMGALAGCGNEETEQNQPSSTENPQGEENEEPDEEENPYAEKVSIEIVSNAEVSADVEDFVAETLLEKFNAEVKVVKLPEYMQQLNIRLSGGNIPDIFLIPNRTSLGDMVKNGYVLELTPYLEDLQPTVDFVSDGGGTMTSGVYGDGVYAIPKRETLEKPVLTEGLMIRQDWLDKLEIPMPTNYDELLDAAIAFTEQDPDENGEDDTYGFFSEWGVERMGNALTADLKCSFSSIGTLYVEDGELKSGFYNENMPEALQRVKEWFDAGVVDPDIISSIGAGSSGAVQQCKVGILYGAWTNGWRMESTEVYKAVDPDCEWAWVPMFEGENKNVCFQNVGGGNLFGINPELPEKDPVKFERIIELFNYVSSEEGQRLVCYGREGTEYTMEGDKVVMTEDPDILADAGFVWAYQLTGRDEAEYNSVKFAYVEDKINEITSREAIPSYDTLIVPPETFNKADMDTYVKEEMWKFFYGERDIAEYDDFLKTLEDVYDYPSYLESAEEQLKEFGILE